MTQERLKEELILRRSELEKIDTLEVDVCMGAWEVCAWADGECVRGSSA